MILSKREIEVLMMISEEMTSKEIASKLGLSESTIETYRKNLLLKLNAKSVVGLIKAAIKNGIINKL